MIRGGLQRTAGGNGPHLRRFGGMAAVESAADTGNRILAVILPGRCCPACRREGERLFERTGRGRYDRIDLQDRERDLYLEK